MVSKIPLFPRQAIVAAVLCAALVGMTSTPARARVFVGIGIPFGFGYYPPPVYYPPPPVYYPPPPPVVYAPPQSYTPVPGEQYGNGQACYAGPYVCPMDRPIAPGGSCYCSGNGGQRVWGRAN